MGNLRALAASAAAALALAAGQAAVSTSAANAGAAPGSTARAAAPKTRYPNVTCMDLAVPLYSTDMWKVTTSRPHAQNAIVNFGATTYYRGVGGGPGRSKSSSDLRQIDGARARHVTLLGYIWTNYDNTDPAGYPTLSGLAKAIEGQMTQWYHWYGIRNFFLDGVTSAAGHQTFYARIRTWANTTFRHDTGITPSIWLNPGTYPASSYATIANAILDYEAPTPPPALPAGSWEYRYPATKFINIINDYTGSVPAALSAASAAHAGQVFITSDPDYQKLPSYWDTEAADARASCQTAVGGHGRPSVSSNSAGAAYTESGAWATYPAAGGTLGQLRLPAGKQVVNAQVVVSVPSTSGRASVACLIGGEGDYRGLLNVPTGSWQMVTIPVEHAFSLSSAQTIKVTCSASAKFQGGATVIATAVSAIHNQ